MNSPVPSSMKMSLRLAVVTFMVLANLAGAAQLVAHWKLDGSGPPYADLSNNAISLGLDFNTAAPLPTVGADGGAAQLRWQNPPGVATRLIAYSAAVQHDSFGFSF